MDKPTITKETAARRLIINGVRMWNRADDPVAIQVVAMAALGIMRELISGNGDSFSRRAIRIALYELALVKLGKRLPKSESVPPMIDQFVQVVADGIKSGELDGPEGIPIPNEINDWDFLRPLIRSFNFLKHADRDPDDAIYEDDITPREALLSAITAYEMIFRNPWPLEVPRFIASATAAR